MENREDLNSILPLLPLILRSSSLCWPSKALESLKALSRGPQYSQVNSGAILFDAIVDLRDSIGLSKERLRLHAADGYALFFDDLMDRVESGKWFGEIIPSLASLLLRLPSLLEDHYRNTDSIFSEGKDGSIITTGLRLLGSQEAGIVFLSQELIGALLACSFFCLFPTLNRSSKHLPTINFDNLFEPLYSQGNQSQEHKIKCIIHYFKRICLCMPMGFVSFERKVLPLKHSPFCIVYPDADFWSKSIAPLCSFKVLHSGLIEDQQYEALEVDFANKYIGGGALHSGCVQEEIRFMINPELIVSMLFLPSMEDNEAIEIIGAERFSNYRGYASSFRFLGDYLDKKPIDSMGRRKTRIVAIDALCNPRMTQYRLEGLLREANKAFCGFLDQSKYQQYLKLFQEGSFSRDKSGQDIDGADIKARNILPAGDESLSIRTCDHVSEKASCSSPGTQLKLPVSSASDEAFNERASGVELIGNYYQKHSQGPESQNNIGIATGNWGCGAFGGDPELKCTIQWLAASQVSQWILLQEWTVGDLWNMLIEYLSQKWNGETRAGFLSWLLPSLPEHDDMITVTSSMSE
ncbi:poly(ADP-ribose) glycohydrolase 1-like isoform X2 [Magnolia sinica]|uniref:poly(ADP-ribose) glycohydrolase 1-like isoform X2 n=1 Tax=Magnolia sinica TaxID=86752 RepID=UPI00265B446A|nr:poly(ADP-ribose) glycohydrolase 1-like isoform X2 [Magnolia sinica]